MASYYRSGKMTANGEKFNPHGHTAAHRSLPFGTKVRVVNVRNGKAVVVQNQRSRPVHPWADHRSRLGRGTRFGFAPRRPGKSAARNPEVEGKTEFRRLLPSRRRAVHSARIQLGVLGHESRLFGRSPLSLCAGGAEFRTIRNTVRTSIADRIYSKALKGAELRRRAGTRKIRRQGRTAGPRQRISEVPRNGLGRVGERRPPGGDHTFRISSEAHAATGAEKH